jgi:uncharacterized protein DUF1259
MQRWMRAAARMASTSLAVIGLCTIGIAQVKPAPAAGGASDWKRLDDVFGFHGDTLPGDVVRFNMPRSDLHVTVGGVQIKPGLALGAWAAFHPVGANDAMIMGDLVLTDDEVAPAMRALQEGGVEVTALHNHLLGESTWVDTEIPSSSHRRSNVRSV